MTDLERKAIGERIEAFRKSQNPKLTQKAFGEPIKLSRSVINNIERGAILHIENYLKSIELYYHINPVWLETGVGDMMLEKTKKDVVEELFANSDVFTKTWMKTLVSLSDTEWELFKDQLTMIEDIRKQGV